MKYVLILSAILLSACSSLCPGVLCATGGSSTTYYPEAKPTATATATSTATQTAVQVKPPLNMSPDNLRDQLPAFQASWGLKRALYDNMNTYYAGYNKTVRYVAIVDFSQHSSKSRFYLFDMKAGTVERHNVSHGSGSDRNNDGMADTFSNVAGSNASSLGMYKTAETYSGKHGYSLRLDGLESSNSNARARAVVMHSATYVKDGKSAGRSWGCPALDPKVYVSVIDRLKGGSLLLIGK